MSFNRKNIAPRRSRARIASISLIVLALCGMKIVSAAVGTWTSIGPSIATAVSVDSATGDLYASGPNGTFVFSADSGASWSVVPPPAAADCRFDYFVPGNGSLLAAGGFQANGPFDTADCDRTHYRSADHGQSWTLLPPWPSDFIQVATSDPTN